MEDLTVEVRRENVAYYKAIVIDVLDKDVSVLFGNDWQPANKFPFQRIRRPSTVYKDGNKREATECQEVEVFAKASDREVSGWWEAVVKMTKATLTRWSTKARTAPALRLYLVTGCAITTSIARSPRAPSLSFELEVPENFREYCASSKDSPPWCATSPSSTV